MTVIRIGDDCHGDMNTVNNGIANWLFLMEININLQLRVFLSKIWYIQTNRQTDTTMYRVVPQLKIIKEAGAGPSSSLVRV